MLIILWYYVQIWLNIKGWRNSFYDAVKTVIVYEWKFKSLVDYFLIFLLGEHLSNGVAGNTQSQYLMWKALCFFLHSAGFSNL